MTFDVATFSKLDCQLLRYEMQSRLFFVMNHPSDENMDGQFVIFSSFYMKNQTFLSVLSVSFVLKSQLLVSVEFRLCT